MEVTVSALSDVGRVRTNNEDSLLADTTLGLYIVCDGMGGHAAGEVASATACEVLQREVEGMSKLRERFVESGKTSDAKALRKALEAAVQSAGREIHKKASRTPELTGMGTTCTVVLLIDQNKAILAHVGDSRLYVLRGGKVYQLSEDHTYVNELVKRGALSREQAKKHPQGNVLSRALGVQPNVNVDTMVFDVDAGDTYLLCSDGLYNYFPAPDELAQRLDGTDLRSSVADMIQTALSRGGHDNCTAVAMRVGGTPPPAETAVAAQQRIDILKNIPLFAHLTYNELVQVLGLTQLGRIEPGGTFIREDEQGDELYVVLAGEVDVVKSGHHLATLKAGAHLGEMALVDHAPRSATVTAKTAVNLLTMRREEFFGLIRSQPVIATKLLWSFVQALSGRLRQTNAALEGAQKDSGDFEIFVDELE
ncbi:MAG: Stp1/IreP family PP2C-type Ser/Thr phosphatase [Myxococcota bacterium]